MRRPPPWLAFALMLGACSRGRPSPPAAGGGTRPSPGAGPRLDAIDELLAETSRAADAQPGGGQTQEVGPTAPAGPGGGVESESPEGNGSGFSRGVGGIGPRRVRPPDIIPGTPTVEGSIDKEIIRRIVQRYGREQVKYCYHRELLEHRALGGRATFEFTISPQGEVARARLSRATLHAPRMESCLVAAIRSWVFPYPHGDRVTVSYPFSFLPGGPDYIPTPPPKPEREFVPPLTEPR
jgi:TonB family protein